MAQPYNLPSDSGIAAGQHEAQGAALLPEHLTGHPESRDSVLLSGHLTGQHESQGAALLSEVWHSTTEAWQWTKDNVVKPAYNTVAVQPVNTISSLVNGASHELGGKSVLPELTAESVPVASSFSAAWWAQNISSGLAASFVYAAAGKAAGSVMRSAGRAMRLEGAVARIAADESLAQIAGAAAYDGLRVPGQNETRLGNMAGGAIGFYLLGKGQGISEQLGMGAKLLTRVGTGAVSATVQLATADLISRHKLSDGQNYLDAALSGSAMNLALPTVQEHLSKGIDHFNIALGHGIPLSRYVTREGLSGSSARLDLLIKDNALARVQPGSEENKIDHKRDIIYLKGKEPGKLGHELTHRSNYKEHEGQFQQAAELLKSGQEEAAWEVYKKTRLMQETEAREAEHDIGQEISNSPDVMKSKTDIVQMPESQAATYEEQWRKEFKQFQETEGKYRPEVDYDVEEKYGRDITYNAVTRSAYIKYCAITDKELQQFLQRHPDLQQLGVYNCLELTSLPLEKLSNLQHLRVNDCRNLTSLPLEKLHNLQQLTVQYCPKLTSLPLEKLHNLQQLTVYNCDNLTSLRLESLSNLQQLKVEYCDNLTSLPLEKLSNLQHLRVNDCRNLTSLPLENLSNLQQLMVNDCDNLTSLPLENLSNLQRLEVEMCPVKNLSLLPPGLRELFLKDCKSLHTLPEALPNGLTLTVDGCDNLDIAKYAKWLPKEFDPQKVADIILNTADAIEKHLPKDATYVILGRDAWPLVPVMRQRGLDTRYFLFSRLQLKDISTAKRWKEEIPPNTIVIDTGYQGSILRRIKEIDPTINGYLMCSRTSDFKQIPGLNLGDADLVRYVEFFPKAARYRAVGYSEKGNVRWNNASWKEVSGKRRRVESPNNDADQGIWRGRKETIEANRQLLEAMGLPKKVVDAYVTFTGVTPEERRSNLGNQEVSKNVALPGIPKWLGGELKDQYSPEIGYGMKEKGCTIDVAAIKTGALKPSSLLKSGKFCRTLQRDLDVGAQTNNFIEANASRFSMDTIRKLSKLARTSVVRIVAMDLDNEDAIQGLLTGKDVAIPTNCGSGFFINEDKDIITSLHVVDKMPNIRIYTNESVNLYGSSECEWRYRVHKRFPKEDLAWLKTTEWQRGYMPKINVLNPISDQAVMTKGAMLVSFGFPNSSTKMAVSPGFFTGETINAATGDFPVRNMHAIATHISCGNSGGPVLTADGRVLGMVKAVTDINDPARERGCVVPISRILQRLGS